MRGERRPAGGLTMPDGRGRRRHGVERDVNEVVESARIVNRLGLHARPAAEFVKLAGRFESEIWVEKDGLEVNGKSIMGVMMLAAEAGSQIRIRALGPDADAAMTALLGLIRNGFGENEEAELAEEYDVSEEAGS